MFLSLLILSFLSALAPSSSLFQKQGLKQIGLQIPDEPMEDSILESVPEDSIELLIPPLKSST